MSTQHPTYNSDPLSRPASFSGAVGVRMSKVCLSYVSDQGPVPVFPPLSFELAPRSWTALIGSSGVGKSSLVRLICGLFKDGEQGVRVSGDVCGDDGLPLTGRVAWMAQDDLLLPWLTVAENVSLGGRLRRRGHHSHERAMSLLDAVGLSAVADALPETLSGGMKQRVALARTLFEDKPIILMDEPFSALDVITRRRLQDLALRLLAGRTVLMITHDPAEALRLVDVIQILTPDGLADQPISPTGTAPRPMDTLEIATLQETLVSRLLAATQGAA